MVRGGEDWRGEQGEVDRTGDTKNTDGQTNRQEGREGMRDGGRKASR